MKGEIKIVKTRVDNLEVGDIIRFHPRPNDPAWSNWFEVEDVRVIRQAAGAPSQRMTLRFVGGDVRTASKLDVVEVQVDVAPSVPKFDTIRDVIAEAHQP